jgi:hypothetical protein
MRDKIQKLYELQLYRLFKTIEIKKKIKYNDLYNCVNRKVVDFKNIELEKKEDTSVLLLNKLNHLLNNVPDFIMCNKTLTDMTTSFIRICNNDSIDTSSLNEDVVNSMLISWIENQI